MLIYCEKIGGKTTRGHLAFKQAAEKRPFVHKMLIDSVGRLPLVVICCDCDHAGAQQWRRRRVASRIPIIREGSDKQRLAAV